MTTTDPVEQHRRRSDRNRTYNIAMLVIVFVAASVITATVIIGVVKIDAKSSHQDVVVGKIRATQLQTEPVLICLLRGDNGILKDVPLAFSRDMNAKDYAAVVACKLPPEPHRTRR